MIGSIKLINLEVIIKQDTKLNILNMFTKKTKPKLLRNVS